MENGANNVHFTCTCNKLTKNKMLLVKIVKLHVTITKNKIIRK